MSEVLDVVEETVEAIERIPSLNLNGTTKKQQIIILGTTAVVSLLVGGTVSHFVTKKVLATKFDKVLAQEMDATRAHYNRMYKVSDAGVPLTPQDVFENLQVDDKTKEAMEAYQGKGHVITAEPPVATEAELMNGTYVRNGDGTVTQEQPVEVKNIFEDHEPLDDDWDFVEEVANRTPAAPYVISHQEYFEAEQDYEQEDLTYFVGDQQLADSNGVLVSDPAGTIGDNLLFGHGSLNANVVYVRNDRLKCDFEITKSFGKYAHEVLGLDMEETEETEIRHSMRRPRKMRSTDE